MADLKTRRAVLERQVGILESHKQSTDDVLVPSKDQIERFSEQAKLLLFDLSFTPKQRIIRKVVDTVISDQKIMRVRGYLPIKEAQNVKFRSEGRELHHATPTYEPIDFPFQYNFKLPDPRKARIKLERDALGRIIHSNSPEMS